MDLFGDLPEPEAQSTLESSVQTPFNNHNIEKIPAIATQQLLDENRGTKRKHDENNVNDNKERGTLYDVQGFSAEKKGERDEMQDYHLIIDDFRKSVPHLHSSVSRLSCYSVYDGHGGARASKYTAEHLHQNLAQNFPKVPLAQIEKEMKRTITEAFKKTDDDFLKEATKMKPSWKDGTTAIVVLILENVLYISNLGDSKAILCRYNKELGKHVAVPLSVDHSPTDYKERMRIQKAGGYVRDGRVMGIIEVSRSIGDGQYKALGLTCIPDVKRCQLVDEDSFVLLACDGLWKVFTSEEVIEVVLSSRKEGCPESSEICYETACNRLVNEAIRKYSGDNVTVVIISIQKLKNQNQ